MNTVDAAKVEETYNAWMEAVEAENKAKNELKDIERELEQEADKVRSLPLPVKEKLAMVAPITERRLVAKEKYAQSRKMNDYTRQVYDSTECGFDINFTLEDF